MSRLRQLSGASVCSREFSRAFLGETACPVPLRTRCRPASFDLGLWTLDLGRTGGLGPPGVPSRPAISSGSRISRVIYPNQSRPDCRAGSPLNGSTLTGGTLVGGSTPLISIERDPSGYTFGGGGGTTCPGARGSFSPSILYVKKGSPPRRGSFFVPAGRHPRVKKSRTEICSLHSATKTRSVQDQFSRNPGFDAAD